MDERRRRQLDHPDPAEILAIAIGPGRRLWERGRTHLTGWSSGSGRGRSVRGPAGCATPARRSAPPSADAPVTVDIAATGSLGIVGDDQAVLAAGRALIGQIRGSPRAARSRIWPLVPGGGDLGWLTWLPHTAAAPSAERLLALARARTARPAGPGDGRVRPIRTLGGRRRRRSCRSRGARTPPRAPRRDAGP